MHTYQTHNFAPADNAPRGCNTAVAVADHIVAFLSRTLFDNLTLLDKILVEKFGKLRATFYRSQARFQSRPFSFGTRLSFLAVPYVVGSFSMVSLVWHPAGFVPHLTLGEPAK